MEQVYFSTGHGEVYLGTGNGPGISRYRPWSRCMSRCILVQAMKYMYPSSDHQADVS